MDKNSELFGTSEVEKVKEYVAQFVEKIAKTSAKGLVEPNSGINQPMTAGAEAYFSQKPALNQ